MTTLDMISYSKDKKGMIRKRLEKFGINNFEIRRQGDGRYHILIKRNNKITDIGTVNKTKDNRWKINRLYYKVIENL